ncbi:MAG: PilZ domain-containing protein [Proteobacteria bacterium]|nr:PilZ domain-containing protein [Pseudomonadota bacterium]
MRQIEKYFSQINLNDYRPDIFPLGYHVKRSEPRLIYVMPITMIYQGELIEAKSKNISAMGLQIFIPRKMIIEDTIVQLTFEKFKKEYSTNPADELVNFDSIDYLIKSVQYIDEKTYISLVQKNLSEATIDFFDHFVTTNRLRYKIDATDRIYASKAQYYENLYTNNMQHVPMFIRWNQTNGLYIDTIVKTEKNHHFFDYFCDDMTSFCLPSRIEKFVILARKQQSALFFSYRISGELHTIFDFEIQSKNDLVHILKKVKALKGRIYKIFTNLNKKPTHEKITAMLSQIQTLDVMESKILDKRVNESITQIVLTDITQVYLRKIISAEFLQSTTNSHELSSSVLINYQQVSMSDGQIIHHYDKSTFHTPEIIYFSIFKNRYDERYIYEMDVNLRIERQNYAAKTIDFSRTGVGLVIPHKKDDSDIIANDLVGNNIKITFSSLMIKGITTELKHISHRIVIAHETSDGLFLGVIRDTSVCGPKVNQFFSDLVKNNKGNLELCVKDQTENIYTSFYESFFTENIETIPIVIARDKVNHHYIREIGLTNPPCHLAENFYIKDQGYNYRFLSSKIRLNELHQRTVNSSDKKSGAFMLFTFKAKNNNGINSIFSVTDFEVINEDEIKIIIKIVLENNGACIHIQFVNNLLVDKLFRKMTIEKVNYLNKASAKLLTKEYNKIIGFAEMIDLTNEYRQQYQS